MFKSFIFSRCLFYSFTHLVLKTVFVALIVINWIFDNVFRKFFLGYFTLISYITM